MVYKKEELLNVLVAVINLLPRDNEITDDFRDIISEIENETFEIDNILFDRNDDADCERYFSENSHDYNGWNDFCEIIDREDLKYSDEEK